MSRKLLSLFSVAALALLINIPAHAGLLLEPYVGYYSGTATSGSPSTTNNLKGIGYGGRVGFTQMGFMAGLDYMTGSMKDDVSPTNDNLTPTFIGAFLGYNFPMLVRVYAAYDFSSQVKVSSPTFTDTVKGTGIKLGVGFKVIPMVSINLEYIANTYTKDDFVGSLSPNDTDKIYGLSVSIPLDLL